jgi:pilus assembly protein CpaC
MRQLTGLRHRLPQVLGQGRIRLEVAPEVSELSEIGALKQNGFTIPAIVTRRSNT